MPDPTPPLPEPTADGAAPRAPGPMIVSRASDMGWSGIQTFAKAPLCLTPADLRAASADVAVGGAPWEVGLRGYWPEPPILDWMEAQRMRTHFMAEIRADGFDAVLERALAQAMDTADHLYISVDVDSADPAFAPGTGTPEPGGLTSGEVLRAVRRLAAEVGAVGMDVVEVSPPYDAGNNITALFANRLVMEALTGTAMRRLGITQPDYADPRALGARTQAPGLG